VHRHWKTALRFVPLCLLAVVLWRQKPWTVGLSAGAPWVVAASILLNLVGSLPLKAARWRVALIDPPPFRQVLAATIEGLLANAAIGFGSGDVVRSARLRREPRERRERGMAADYASSLAERGAEVLALAIMVIVVSIATGVGSLARGPVGLGPLALALSGLAAVGYAALLVAGKLLVPRLARWPRVQQALAAGLQASTPRRVAGMVALSLLGWSLEIVMLMLFQGAFGLAPSLRTAMLTLVGINAAVVIPAVPGNFGTFEAGVALVLVMCGAPRDVAVSYALAYHLSHVIPVAVIATAVFLYRSRRYSTTPSRTSIGR
jgi:uncharacterized membrane protein YbhN (UPF0104 family)